MFISFGLFYIFSTLATFSSLFVITTKNPVFSVLFLIFSFTNISCFLFLLNFEFLPIAFLIIYVGAIAVLFLFVLMMLNIKLAELKENYTTFIPIAFLFAISFIIEFLFLFRCEFDFLTIYSKNSLDFLSEFLYSPATGFYEVFGLYPNLKTLANVIFLEYFYSFLVAGYILLLAMVGAIVLTVQKKFVSKTQNIYTQIMADFNNTIVNFS